MGENRQCRAKECKEGGIREEVVMNVLIALSKLAGCLAIRRQYHSSAGLPHRRDSCRAAMGNAGHCRRPNIAKDDSTQGPKEHTTELLFFNPQHHPRHQTLHAPFSSCRISLPFHQSTRPFAQLLATSSLLLLFVLCFASPSALAQAASGLPRLSSAPACVISSFRNERTERGDKQEHFALWPATAHGLIEPLTLQGLAIIH
jgi:hypothetical protein